MDTPDPIKTADVVRMWQRLRCAPPPGVVTWPPGFLSIGDADGGVILPPGASPEMVALARQFVADTAADTSTVVEGRP
jgi:hypothetical protein